MFKLQEDVWEVDAEGVVARQVELLPALARRTRHSGSAKSLWQLSDEETSRLELAAEESFAALELDVTKRKRGSRKEKDSEKEEPEKVREEPETEQVDEEVSDEEVVENAKKKKNKKKKKKKKKRRCSF